MVPQENFGAGRGGSQGAVVQPILPGGERPAEVQKTLRNKVSGGGTPSQTVFSEERTGIISTAPRRGFLLFEEEEDDDSTGMLLTVRVGRRIWPVQNTHRDIGIQTSRNLSLSTLPNSRENSKWVDIASVSRGRRLMSDVVSSNKTLSSKVSPIGPDHRDDDMDKHPRTDDVVPGSWRRCVFAKGWKSSRCAAMSQKTYTSVETAGRNDPQAD
jgi:hypothetical protein